MSLKDENEAENADQIQSDRGSGRRQRIWVGVIRNLPALIFSSVAAVFFVMRFDFTPDITGRIDILFLFALITFIAYIFWLICVSAITHMKAGVRYFREGKSRSDDIGEESGNRDASPSRQKDMKNNQRGRWLWWAQWVFKLLQILCGAVLFLGLYLSFVLDDHGVFALLQYLSWSLPFFLLVFLIGILGCGLIVRIAWKWRELKIMGSLGSILMAIPCIALAIGLSPMVTPHLLLAIPDLFLGAQRAEQAHCLSSEMHIRHALNDTCRSPLPAQRYVEYTFLLTVGQGDPFETNMRVMGANTHSRLATELSSRCGNGQSFTLEYFPSTKRLIAIH